MKSDTANYPPGAANDPNAPYNQGNQVTHLVCKECGTEDTFSDQKDKAWECFKFIWKGRKVIRILRHMPYYRGDKAYTGPNVYTIHIDDSPNRPYDEKAGKWQCLDCGSFNTEVEE